MMPTCIGFGLYVCDVFWEQDTIFRCAHCRRLKIKDLENRGEI